MLPYQNLYDHLTSWLAVYIAALVTGETILSFLLFKKTYRKELQVNLLAGAVSFFTVGFFKTYIFTWLFYQNPGCIIQEVHQIVYMSLKRGC